MDFIRWRRARGYEVEPFKRVFWGRHAWRKTRIRKDKFAPLFEFLAHMLRELWENESS